MGEGEPPTFGKLMLKTKPDSDIKILLFDKSSLIILFKDKKKTRRANI